MIKTRMIIHVLGTEKDDTCKMKMVEVVSSRGRCNYLTISFLSLGVAI